MISVFHYSEAGGHAENEDAFQVACLPSEPRCYLCVVADGQGGRAGGAVAARTACKATFDAALACSVNSLRSPGTWMDLLQATDQAVASTSKAGFTTIVAFCVSDGWICGVSNGDSAAVLFQAGNAGVVLTAHQHKNPPVGNGDAVFMPFAAELLLPWSVLAMTDGVWKYAGWDKILRCSVDDTGPEICDALRDSAKMQRTGTLQDDFTVVVLKGQHG